jgi:hypothetical protein
VACSNRRSKTELVKVELDRASLICKERIDGLMEQFKEPQPDFYNAYHAARDIIDTGDPAADVAASESVSKTAAQCGWPVVKAKCTGQSGTRFVAAKPISSVLFICTS